MNILIVEDDEKIAHLLKKMIEEHQDCIVTQVCSDIESTVIYLKKNQSKIDFIFLDVLLEDGESFEVFKQIEINKPVVYCSENKEFLLKAFKNNGVDYILKPIQQKEVDEALRKIRLLTNSFNKVSASSINFSQGYQGTLLVSYREKMIPLRMHEIGCIALEEGHTYAYKFSGEKFAIGENMDELESMINPAHFFRINRQMIVNRFAIIEIEPYFNRKMVVNLGSTFPEKPVLSRLKVSPFLEWIKK